jgi:hypothetical protein
MQSAAESASGTGMSQTELTFAVRGFPAQVREQLVRWKRW